MPSFHSVARQQHLKQEAPTSKRSVSRGSSHSR